MNNKRMLIFMVTSIGILLGWQFFINYMGWVPKPKPLTTPAPISTTEPSTQPVVIDTISGGPEIATTSGPTTTTAHAGLRVQGASEPASHQLGSSKFKDQTYSLALNLSPRGASIDSVVLNQYKEKVDKDDLYSFVQSYPEDAEGTRTLATRSITVTDEKGIATFNVGTEAWELERSDVTSATYRLNVLRGDEQVLIVRKTYTLTLPSEPTEGYEVKIDYSFQNVTGRAVTVQTNFNGPTTPPRELVAGVADREIVGGYEVDREAKMSSHYVETFEKDHISRDLTKDDKGRSLLWTGTSSVYFNAFLRPDPIDASKGWVPDYIAKVEARAINPTDEAPKRHVLTTLETTTLTVDPGKTTTLPMRLYVGPKKRSILNNAHYSAMPLMFNVILGSRGMCGYCAFTPLINGLVGMLGIFHTVTRDWGLAIICLVLVVRLVLHPVTKKSQVSMMKMSKMGPEMERLKKKYGDDKEAISKAQMELMKEQGATPILGCLPMFLQMPIWIALYTGLSTTFELRQAPFLWGYTWIHDLAKPDALIKFAQPISLLFGWHIDSINILPLLMAVVTFINMKFQPQPVVTDPQQEQTQKMMKWTSMLFPLMFYGMPSGLNLYYVTSMGIGIIESKRIRDHIKQKEEAEKGDKVIVDVKPSRQSKRNNKEAVEPPKKKGLMGMLADLQAKAEQMRDQQNRDKK